MTTPIPSEELIAKLKAMHNRKHLPADGRGIYLGDGVHDSIRAQDVIDMLEELQRLREHSSKEVAEPYAMCQVDKPHNSVKYEHWLKWPKFARDEYSVKLFTTPPSSHQAASSMKQKCLDAIDSCVEGQLFVANQAMALKIAKELIEAIPTVEESK
jgi:hypothetical protein